jgi:hypothetical protein
MLVKQARTILPGVMLCQGSFSNSGSGTSASPSTPVRKRSQVLSPLPQKTASLPVSFTPRLHPATTRALHVLRRPPDASPRPVMAFRATASVLRAAKKESVAPPSFLQSLRKRVTTGKLLRPDVEDDILRQPVDKSLYRFPSPGYVLPQRIPSSAPITCAAWMTCAVPWRRALKQPLTSLLVSPE